MSEQLSLFAAAAAAGEVSEDRLQVTEPVTIPAADSTTAPVRLHRLAAEHRWAADFKPWDINMAIAEAQAVGAGVLLFCETCGRFSAIKPGAEMPKRHTALGEVRCPGSWREITAEERAALEERVKPQPAAPPARLRCQRKDGSCSVFGEPCPGLEACTAEIAARNRNWPKCQECGAPIEAPSSTQATRCNACVQKQLDAEVAAVIGKDVLGA
jgi:hypothetical protein